MACHNHPHECQHQRFGSITHSMSNVTLLWLKILTDCLILQTWGQENRSKQVARRVSSEMTKTKVDKVKVSARICYADCAADAAEHVVNKGVRDALLDYLCNDSCLKHPEHVLVHYAPKG